MRSLHCRAIAQLIRRNEKPDFELRTKKRKRFERT